MDSHPDEAAATPSSVGARGLDSGRPPVKIRLLEKSPRTPRNPTRRISSMLWGGEADTHVNLVLERNGHSAGLCPTFIWNLTCRTPVFSTQGETMQRLLRDSRRPEGRARGRTQKIVQETCFEIPSRQEPRSGCYRGIQRYKLRFNAWLEAYQTRFCFVKLKHYLTFNISFSWKLSGMRMPSWVTRTKDSSTTSVKKRGDILRVTALATGTSSPIFPLRTSSICSSEEATRQVSHHFGFSCQGIQ